MLTYHQCQGLISDIFGGLTTVWGLYLLTVRPADWIYFGIVTVGLTTVVGKKIIDTIPTMGMGGGVIDNVTNERKESQSKKY